nr:MAG TPA: hypothetical protein [Caudoviricetes sp.]
MNLAQSSLSARYRSISAPTAIPYTDVVTV